MNLCPLFVFCLLLIAITSSAVISICAYMLMSVNSYLTMKSINGLLTFLPLLLTAKQEFPRRYHHINMSNFRSDLKDIFPANSVSLLYDQYIHDLSHILDRHAPLVSILKTKQQAVWLSESYRLAKSLRRQFELAWQKDKSQYNRSRLWCQIAWCSHLAS